jgi:hypothetical protein
MSQPLKNRIQALLATHGWTALDSTAIASRDYRTAVGIKTAHVYLADFGASSPNAMLQGDYLSEGRNVLGGINGLIRKDVDDADLARLVQAFAASAHAAVEASYAARLLRLTESQPEDPTPDERAERQRV